MAFLIRKSKNDDGISAPEKFIFNSQMLKKLYKQYDSVLNPEKHLQKLMFDKDYEKERSEGRREYKRKLDEKRDKTPKRKQMHKDVDKKRDKNPKRKAMHRRIDKERNTDLKRKTQLSNFERTHTRRFYVNKRNKLAYQQKLYDSFTTDTGFDVVCSSCLQYKSIQNCKPALQLSKEMIRKYLINQCFLLKTKIEGRFVCNLCLQDINLSLIHI